MMRRARAASPWAAAACLLTACSSGTPGRPPAVPVTAARVERRDVPVEVRANGTVEPLQTVSVLSRVEGTVQRVAFQEGDEVGAGQVLFQLDSRPYQAALEQAQGNLLRDIAQARNAELQAARYQKLVEKDFVSSQQYDQARANAEALRAAVKADSAAAASARLNLEYATIRSPIDGRTGSLLVHRGNLVRAGSGQPLVVINQVRPVLVRFSAPERYLSQLLARRSDSLVVYAQPSGEEGKRAEGRLTFVDNSVDTSTGTVALKARFPNEDESLWPGEYLDVRLVLDVERGAVVVPQAAVTSGQSGTYVYVVNPSDSSVASQDVTVARSTDSLDVIASGLQGGEIVVTDGQLRLFAGARADITNAAELAADTAGATESRERGAATGAR
jgi:multidrug efflux system membrane fusion protein